MQFPKVLTTIFLTATALGVEAGLLSLANWQHHRYLQRVDEQAEFSARPSITVSGIFQNSQTFALTNQPDPVNPEADLGWRLLTPLQTASGTLIIDRGYTPAVTNADGTPNFSHFATTATTVSGVFQPFPQRHGWLHGPDVTTDPHLLAFLNPSLIISDTQPIYLIARSSTSPGLTAVPPPLVSPEKHLSYMLQWLGMAIAFPILCACAIWKKRRSKKPPIA